MRTVQFESRDNLLAFLARDRSELDRIVGPLKVTCGSDLDRIKALMFHTFRYVDWGKLQVSFHDPTKLHCIEKFNPRNEHTWKLEKKRKRQSLSYKDAEDQVWKALKLVSGRMKPVEGIDLLQELLGSNALDPFPHLLACARFERARADFNMYGTLNKSLIDEKALQKAVDANCIPACICLGRLYCGFSCPGLPRAFGCGFRNEQATDLFARAARAGTRIGIECLDTNLYCNVGVEPNSSREQELRQVLHRGLEKARKLGKVAFVKTLHNV